MLDRPSNASSSHAADASVSSSFCLLPFVLHFVPFCVNLARERVLELEGPQIDKEDLAG